MKSLKQLHTTLSIIIAIIVITTTWYGNAYIEQEHQQFLKLSEDRSKVTEIIHEISTTLWNCHSTLEDLLLLPRETSYFESFQNSLSQASVTTAALIELNWETTNRTKSDLISLLESINKIENITSDEATNIIKGNVETLGQKVSPLLEVTLKEIDKTENYVHNLSKQDLIRLSNSKDSLIQTILLLATGGLLVIIILYFSINNILLKPLKKLTYALNKEALGEDTEKLPLPKYFEMQQLISAFVNMQDEVKLRQSQLEHQALHDGLTGLPNRVLLLDRIQQLIKDAHRNKSKPAVIILDLDHFKEINDTLGHHIGDLLLQDVSKRLKNVLRNLDSIARLGGDEFAILLHNVDLEGSKIVANKITNALALPFLIESHQLLVRCSQGIALYPEHGKNDTDLLKHADVAMYIAKRGHFGHNIYNPDEDHHNITDLSLSADLKDAINNNELQLFYQPKVDSKTGKVIETEALLRWIHPDKGFISPELIVESAEQSGLIHPLTEWVITTAINQTSAWQKEGIDVGVAVNLSAYNLQNPHLVTIIKYLLDSSGLDSNKFILEVTESAMMLNPKLAASVLTMLSNMGLKVAIDDFGTGYSSLAYLKNLPVHELKIDRSFVMNIVTDKSDISIVKSTIELAHNLGLSVVAEGVEDQESWDILDTLGCDLIQGYYISKPLPVKDFNPWYIEYSLGLIEDKQA